MSTSKQTTSSPPHQVLDPCLLGRPVHLLPDFTLRLRDDLAALLDNLNRRYKASFHIEALALARLEQAEGAQRWLAFSADGGQIRFALERSILLAVLDYRYGRRADATAAAAEPASGESATGAIRVTATEERLAASLGMQFVTTLAARIAHFGKIGGAALASEHEFSVASALPPPKGSWTLSLALRDQAGGVHGRLWLMLDEAWMTRLLRSLAPARESVNKQPARLQPLPARLHLKLTCHLANKEMLLGELLQVQVGDLIPITLGRTDVLLDDSRLFTAEVAEHQGKLCLTSFEDVE